MKAYDIITKSGFYPGTMWAKRIGRLVVVWAIGLNIFINDFQDHTLKQIDARSSEIAAITEAIDIEQVRIDKIERKSWTAYSMDWLSYFIDSPKANEVNQVIEFSNETLDKVERVNSKVGQLDKGTAMAMHILRYTSMLMWIPIALSLFWLLIDIRKGNERLFVGLGLILSIPFSLFSYSCLVELSGMGLG